MTSLTRIRFPIRFDRGYGLLSTALFLTPSVSYIELRGAEVAASMGWAFRAEFPRAAVASARRSEARPLSRGVHGWAGRWLVNGSGQGLVSLSLQPRQRGYVLGFPVGIQELIVSVEAPEELIRALGG
jgi:hypothetical protein